MTFVAINLRQLFEDAGLSDNVVMEALNGDTNALYHLVRTCCCAHNTDAFVQKVRDAVQRHMLKSGSLMDCNSAVNCYAPDASKLAFSDGVKRLAVSIILGDAPDFEKLTNAMLNTGKNEDQDAFSDIVLRASAEQDELKALLNPADHDVATLSRTRPPRSHTVQSLKELVSIFPQLLPDETAALELFKEELRSKDVLDRALKAEKAAKEYKDKVEQQSNTISQQELLLIRLQCQMEKMQEQLDRLGGGAAPIANQPDNGSTPNSPILTAAPAAAAVLPGAAPVPLAPPGPAAASPALPGPVPVPLALPGPAAASPTFPGPVPVPLALPAGRRPRVGDAVKPPVAKRPRRNQFPGDDEHTQPL